MPAVRWAGGLTTLTSPSVATALSEGCTPIPCASSGTSFRRLRLLPLKHHPSAAARRAAIKNPKALRSWAVNVGNNGRRSDGIVITVHEDLVWSSLGV